MYAVQNMPGSSHFAYFKGTKKECEAWEAKQIEVFPFNGQIRILPNKEVESWKYRDGNPVVSKCKLAC